MSRYITAAVAAFLFLPGALAGQGRVVPAPEPTADTVTVVPGPRYEAGAVRAWLLGSDWRELWNSPLTLPVLDIETFSGGLEIEEQGGGNQSITLHMVDPEGREWIFRSLDKYPAEKIGIGGLAEWVVQDQVSALHPGGQLMIPVLLDALEILHVEPTLYVLPDDPALGEYRETFAGLVGALELKPQEDEGDTPGFAGSRKVVNTGNMLERLEETPEHQVDQRELLRARLLDFVIGDTDRGTDQWRWARYPHPDDPDRYLWRPIPRDRDWSFISGDGAVGEFIRTIYPKHVPYGPTIPGMEAITFSSHYVDRTFLTELNRQEFERQVEYVRGRLTENVIRAAVARLPESYPVEHRERLVETMLARRDDLPRAADEFYDWLAMAVDIHATDEPDRAELVRHPDGRLEVTVGVLEDGELESPYYHRTFLPSETNEVRVFLHGDDDEAVVRGRSDAIPVRIIGGGSDDVLADSSGAGSVHFYDDEGDNTIVEANGTTFDDREFDPPPVPEGLRLGSDWAPDYGDEFGIAPVVAFGEYAGVVVGVGPRWTDFGFRRLPYHWSVQVAPLFAIDAEKPGALLEADYRFENSAHSLELESRWSEFDAIRWFGLGNETEMVAEDLSLVPIDRVSIEPTMVFRYGTWRSGSEDAEDVAGVVVADQTPAAFRAALSVGPVFRHVEPEPRGDSPFLLEPARMDEGVWETGVQGGVRLEKVDQAEVPRRGFRLDALAAAYPGFDADLGDFGTGRATLRGYIPLLLGSHLALRVGGMQAFGDFPAWHTPAIGGRSTIRGYEFMRYAGDAAAFGNAELRVPLLDVPLLVTGELGAFGLADAGRVWVDEESAGDWHTAYGGGLWFSGAGQTVSVYYASGEREQLYLSLGMPF